MPKTAEISAKQELNLSIIIAEAIRWKRPQILAGIKNDFKRRQKRRRR